MSKLIDLTAKRFGRLTVLGRAPNKTGRREAMWFCVCDCCGRPTMYTDTPMQRAWLEQKEKETEKS